MHWLLDLDTALFRFINGTLSNSAFDVIMPLASGNPAFFPLTAVAAIWLVWKQRTRGVLCLLMLALAVGLSDGLVCRAVKYAVGRPRPFVSLADVRLPAERPQPDRTVEREPRALDIANRYMAGGGDYGSMPSSHAGNMFAATMVLFLYYRRSARFMLPLASLVAFSRVYNGVHYLSDVLVGAILGAGTAVALVWALETMWRFAGRNWFPLWWPRLPSLVDPATAVGDPPSPDGYGATGAGTVGKLRGLGASPTPSAQLDAHWLRLGYVLTALTLLGRLIYLASGTIQLSEDEAYQWLWSKHLALSYFSKPPLIAYAQFLGTSLWGDTVFGVRFLSPVIAACLSLVLLRFFATTVNARAGFVLLLIISTTPLMGVGATLMTVDPLSVLFWTLSMVAGWRATQGQGTTKDWLWVGLWMGLGFLSKYTQLFQLICWALFFALWAPARKHLRRPGPWLALAVNAFCTLPVVIWNAQHSWVTVVHVGGNADIHKTWQPTLKYFGDFLGAQAGLLNPVYFVAMLWAAVAFWRRSRHDPRPVYFFSMGAPVFGSYLLWTLHSRVLPNWIAPSVLPLFCLMVVYWDSQWRLGVTWMKPWLGLGLIFGLLSVVVLHDTDLIGRVTKHYLPVNLDPLHRVREWDETARVVGEARRELLAEGKPVFIIANHYGMAGQISFWLPEAKSGLPEDPLVYYVSSRKPENQFYFWPGYGMRKGENAIFVDEIDRDTLKPDRLPEILATEFESVAVVGVSNVMYHSKLLRPLQIAVCRGLK